MKAGACLGGFPGVSETPKFSLAIDHHLEIYKSMKQQTILRLTTRMNGCRVKCWQLETSNITQRRVCKEISL